MRSLFLKRPHFRDLFYSLRAFINFDRSMKPNLQNSISNWSYHYSVYIALLRVYILQPQSLILPIFILTQWGWDFLSCMIWNEVKISKFEFFGHCTQGTTLPIAHNKVRSKVNTKLVREVYTTYLLFSSTYCRFTFYYFIGEHIYAEFFNVEGPILIYFIEGRSPSILVIYYSLMWW